MLTADSQKNMMLSPAAQDLGLGDQLRQELENQLEQRRKAKQFAQPGMGGSANGASFSGSAVSDLLNVSSSGLGV